MPNELTEVMKKLTPELELFNTAASIALTQGAVVCDYTSYKIPNCFVLWGFLSAWFAEISLTLCYGGNILLIPEYAAASAIVLAMLFPVYAAGAVGGGDIKLLAALGGLLGVKAAVKIAVAAMLISLLYGVPIMIIRREMHMHKIHFSYAIFAALIISIMQTVTVF